MFVPDRSWGKSGGVAAALALVFSACASCAHKQYVSLDSCVDEEVVVYVDGRLLEGDPGEIGLRANEPHKLYVKRPGEPPRLVVLEVTEDGEGRPRLEPADPCAELVALGLGRELTIEADEAGAAPELAPAPTP